jgi:predicted ATPase/tRNA A-37 threonylcarbamoyl transferase component Bud32
MIGKTILHYEIIEKLGEGGMGVVYKAHDSKLKRDVGIKFLPRHVADNREQRDRLKIEAQAAAALNHPNIATIYAIEEVDDELFIVMEYIDGQDLKKKLADGPLLPDEMLEIATQAARGLQAAHNEGIVHRDIKSSNLMFMSSGLVKLMDFSLAKVPQSDITKTGATVGTAVYMSPEQLLAEKLDHRTDIWSFGIVLYEMVAGELPFTGPSDAVVIYSILTEDPELKLGRESPTAQGWENIIRKAMQKDANHRYQNIGELLDDLTTLRESGFVEPAPAKPLEPGRAENLPNYLTGFVGRETEIRKIKDLLAKARLITLIGPGGTGKTRLAVQVASEVLSDFDDGVVFVPLASIKEPELLDSKIAQTLKLSEHTSKPSVEVLKEHLGDKNTLLLLDNFEQIIAAAGLVRELLSDCPNLRIMITSRILLRISGEHEFSVPPLATPSLSEKVSLGRVLKFPAIELFVQRAQAANSDFVLDETNAPTVIEICIRLDGLPLGIELAAARVRILSPKVILARLESRLDLLKGGTDDMPERHQTLRQAIAWSYDLLNKEERVFFRRLSVFVGGCSLEAAQHLCDHPTDLALDALDGCTNLMDKSLLRRQEREDAVCFTSYETIREFGLECLKETGELEATKREHAEFLVKLAEQAESELTGPQQARWLNRLEVEHDNLRAAMAWAEEAGEFEFGLRITAAIWRFWGIRGHINEGKHRFDQFLNMPGAEVRSEVRARALNGAGTLTHENGDLPGALPLLSESLEIFRDLGNKNGMATVINNLSWVAMTLGNFEQAKSLSEEGMAICRDLDQKRGVALSLNNLTWLAAYKGEFDDARSLGHESLALRHELGDERGVGFTLVTLAGIEREQGHFEKAHCLLDEAESILTKLEDKQLLAWMTLNLGRLWYAQCEYDRAETVLKDSVEKWEKSENNHGYGWGLTYLADALYALDKHAEADRLLNEAFEITIQHGHKWGLGQVQFRRGRVARKNGDRERAIELQLASLRCRKDLDDKLGLIRSMEEFGKLAADQSDFERSARILGATEALRERISCPMSPCGLAEHRAHVQLIIKELGEEGVDVGKERGRKMAFDEAVEYSIAGAKGV